MVIQDLVDVMEHQAEPEPLGEMVEMVTLAQLDVLEKPVLEEIPVQVAALAPQEELVALVGMD